MPKAIIRQVRMVRNKLLLMALSACLMFSSNFMTMQICEQFDELIDVGNF